MKTFLSKPLKVSQHATNLNLMTPTLAYKKKPTIHYCFPRQSFKTKTMEQISSTYFSKLSHR